ncbi:helix-turn-helix domain-containing protein, partial [Escherichia coli]|uniref:helix-turn-helix domain-containing protein n=1 Tax=Escherichia coli TaxID=562 RepID=UPI00201B031A
VFVWKQNYILVDEYFFFCCTWIVNSAPINYVIQRRMTEAKWSLTNTELSQAEISWRVGYENVDHFAKLFLRHVGCSPSDYRRQFKNCFAEQEILSEFPQPVSLAG